MAHFFQNHSRLGQSGTLSRRNLHAPVSDQGNWDRFLSKTYDTQTGYQPHSSKQKLQENANSRRVLSPQSDFRRQESPISRQSQRTAESSNIIKTMHKSKPVAIGNRNLYRNATSEANILNQQGNYYIYKGNLVQKNEQEDTSKSGRHLTSAFQDEQTSSVPFFSGEPRTPKKHASTQKNISPRKLSPSRNFNAHSSTFELVRYDDFQKSPRALDSVKDIRKPHFEVVSASTDKYMLKRPRPETCKNLYGKRRIY